MNGHSRFLTNKYEMRFFSVIGILLLIFLIISYVVGARIRRNDISSPANIIAVNPFEGISLIADAAYVYDLRTNTVLYSKNADKRLPLASVTKVMTALVATEVAPLENTVVTVTDNALQAEGDSGLFRDERWSLKNLLDFSLTSSSNDGMRAVALALGALNRLEAEPDEIRMDFVRLMNQKANELGMKNTYYFNETGLDETSHQGGAYGTAKDMTMLFAYILKNHPELFEATGKSEITTRSLDGYIHRAKNTDLIVDSIPGIKASKTGFTDIAGGNLVIAFDPEMGRPIIVSVLGSTGNDRFNDVMKLVEASMRAIGVDNGK